MKKVIFVLASIVFAVAIIGCSKTANIKPDFVVKDTPAAAPQEQPDAFVELTYYFMEGCPACSLAASPAWKNFLNKFGGQHVKLSKVDLQKSLKKNLPPSVPAYAIAICGVPWKGMIGALDEDELKKTAELLNQLGQAIADQTGTINCEDLRRKFEESQSPKEKPDIIKDISGEYEI